MRPWVLPLLLLLTVISCQPDETEQLSAYPDQLGSIAFDPARDNPNFRLCDEAKLVHSRLSLSYEGGRRLIFEHALSAFKPEELIDFDGYVMAHFIVNCRGEVGRVRIDPMNNAFEEKQAPESLIAQIDHIVRALDDWVISMPKNVGKDHSKYLNFKIVNGQIDAITH